MWSTRTKKFIVYNFPHKNTFICVNVLFGLFDEGFFFYDFSLVVIILTCDVRTTNGNLLGSEQRKRIILLDHDQVTSETYIKYAMSNNNNGHVCRPNWPGYNRFSEKYFVIVDWIRVHKCQTHTSQKNRRPSPKIWIYTH